jgi:transposase
MLLHRAVPVTLTAAERKTLKKRVRGAKTAHRDWLRAQIVLAATRGRGNARIAADLHVSVDTVRKWRGRFADRGLAGLADLPRSGRPRRISALERAAVIALACQLPAATGVPLARWSGPELAAEITKAGLASQISSSSVLRILAEHPIKPWQYQSWIYPRDPDFAAKASSSTSTRGTTRASGSGPVTGSSRWTPSRPSRPAAGATKPARRHQTGRCASSTNTGARAPSPCSPPWTCTPARYPPPLPPPPPGSPRSWL